METHIFIIALGIFLVVVSAILAKSGVIKQSKPKSKIFYIAIFVTIFFGLMTMISF